MRPEDGDFEELPIQLKLRVLRSELERLESDVYWLDRRKEEILREMEHYRRLLSRTRQRRLLRLVK